MKKVNIFISIIFFLLTVIVFKSWFTLLPLSSGDWSYSLNDAIKSFPFFPYVWSFNFGLGFGGVNSFILALSSYYLFTTSVLFNVFKIPWVLIERLMWFWPFLLISIFSSHFLFKKLFSEKFAILSSFIFLFNTYTLMLVGGGQMGIALSYALFPFTLAIFIKLLDSPNSLSLNLKLSLLAGLLLSTLVFFDVRIAYACIAAISLYLVFRIKYEVSKSNFLDIFNLIIYSLIIPGAVTFLLNSFWIIPLILGGKNPLVELGSAYTSLESVKFFSFAKFEDSLSLLHPNWPENIFGKVGFMKPEFLLLPIFAFSSLLFAGREKKTKTYVLFFALLGLVGVFLAKGTNEPFGGIYLWMFGHIPGFMMFRDSTKWYTLIALSYSVLIPFTIWRLYEFLESQSKFEIFKFKFQIKFKNQIFNFQNIFLILSAFYLIFLIRPAVLGQLNGTFKTTVVPNDYFKFERFLSSDVKFYRVLWVPTPQRFGFVTAIHPAIAAQDFFKTIDLSQIVKKIAANEKLLQESAVKYVVVPYDSQGEIFLKDRRYDGNAYKKIIADMNTVPYLKKIDDFGKIAVFEIPSPKDHFFISNLQSAVNNQKIEYQYVSPVEYKLSFENAKKGDVVVFSESYNLEWIAKNSEFKVRSTEYSKKFNSFVLPQNGNYTLDVYFSPQTYVNIGLVISGATLIVIVGTLIILFKKGKT